MHRIAFIFSILSALAFAQPQTPPTVALLPPESELRTPESRQQLLAELTSPDGNSDLTKRTQFTSSNPAVAKVDAAGVVSPVADGEAIITGKTSTGLTATARIRVKGVAQPFAWSFRNHVTPVLTKMGCNQGACHGALAGKNGFKLTLRGYDPDADYDTLTRQAVGRRISLADPASSLLLKKATFGLPHGGGKRFGVESLEYRVHSEWIASRPALVARSRWGCASATTSATRSSARA